jgi:hypothetical protein
VAVGFSRRVHIRVHTAPFETLASPFVGIEVVQAAYVVCPEALDRALELVVVAGRVQLQVLDQLVEDGDPTE